MLIMYDGGDSYFWEMGVRDGNQEYVKHGACCALYHFGLQYLESQQWKKVLMGYSRPFLHDGALQFKRKWSQRIVGGYHDDFAIGVISPNPAAKAFLCNNPFIFRKHGAFCAAVFLNANSPPCSEKIRELDGNYFHAGLSRLFIYCLNQKDPPTPSRTAAELPQHIELHCNGDLLLTDSYRSRSCR